jgi:hypothetical protein
MGPARAFSGRADSCAEEQRCSPAVQVCHARKQPTVVWANCSSRAQEEILLEPDGDAAMSAAAAAATPSAASGFLPSHAEVRQLVSQRSLGQSSAAFTAPAGGPSTGGARADAPPHEGHARLALTAPAAVRLDGGPHRAPVSASGHPRWPHAATHGRGAARAGCAGRRCARRGAGRGADGGIPGRRLGGAARVPVRGGRAG